MGTMIDDFYPGHGGGPFYPRDNKSNNISRIKICSLEFSGRVCVPWRCEEGGRPEKGPYLSLYDLAIHLLL